MPKHPGSHSTYKKGQELDLQDWPFYALIQAAMRQADTDSKTLLAYAWPEVWAELQARYNAPGGKLEGE